MSRDLVVDCAVAMAHFDAYDSIVDVRSPSEYAEDHLPDAVNFPVLDDAERARVGTLHKEDCAFAAKRLGAALVARNIATHLETCLSDRPRAWRPLVYCWRGGQRSAAMTHVLQSIGWRAQQLDGGYRAFRRHVIGALEHWPLRFRYRVVGGPTGSGKSRLLLALARRGAQVLDLEALAEHRGSVLGSLPERPQPSQKMFETRIWQALRRFDDARVVYVESESRKVGELRVPQRLIERMRSSACIRIDTDEHARVKLLRDEYAHFESDLPMLWRQLDCLMSLHGRDKIADWKALASSGKWDEFVARLLREHYDPAYERSIRSNFAQFDNAERISLAGASGPELDRAATALMTEDR